MLKRESTAQCHSIVLDTTRTTYACQQSKYLGREKNGRQTSEEISQKKNGVNTIVRTNRPGCVLSHYTVLFLPVDIQHTPCPCWFFIVKERYHLCGHQNYDTDTTSYCCKGSRQRNAMPSYRYWIRREQHTHASNPDNVERDQNESQRKRDNKEKYVLYRSIRCERAVQVVLTKIAHRAAPFALRFGNSIYDTLCTPSSPGGKLRTADTVKSSRFFSTRYVKSGS